MSPRCDRGWRLRITQTQTRLSNTFAVVPIGDRQASRDRMRSSRHRILARPTELRPVGAAGPMRAEAEGSRRLGEFAKRSEIYDKRL